eukprot:TRINITY_DN70658_c0_g1_i1.p1 TRINITY_DN70658_c0_g1~~TRINITY_DN70658_c0_g1_i1.p1  ORF type:complete len:242 (-),score=19.72 TRINITY_DN70658_c0_g1_i1:18-743(-)
MTRVSGVFRSRVRFVACAASLLPIVARHEVRLSAWLPALSSWWGQGGVRTLRRASSAVTTEEASCGVAAALASEAERRVAAGELNGRLLDKLAMAPQTARPSALLPPDRVLEHVLASLVLLPLEEAVRQAFLFTLLDVADGADSPQLRRQNWVEGRTTDVLLFPAFRRMLLEEYGCLFDRELPSPTYDAPPQWSDCDHEVSFFVSVETPSFVGTLKVTLRRPRFGTHKDCWLIQSARTTTD